MSHSALTRNRHLVSKPFVIGRPMRGEQTGLSSPVSRSVVFWRGEATFLAGFARAMIATEIRTEYLPS